MADTDKKRIVFLCSGGGGNLRFTQYAIEREWIQNAKIVSVLTDRECQANNFASQRGIENRCIDFDGDTQEVLLQELLRLDPDVIVTNVHKILCSSVVSRYRGRLINLHYSLLPAFGGMIGEKPVRAALDYGAQFTGVTVHWVDESLDGGRPIIQVAIPLDSTEENFKSLMNLVFRCGCIALMASINFLLMGVKEPFKAQSCGIELLGKHCLFSRDSEFPREILDNAVWQHIAKAG